MTRPHSVCYAQNMNIVLEGVVGDRAYGLASTESSTDTLGVFVASTLSVAGLSWTPQDEMKNQTTPEGDTFTYHEVARMLRLLLKGNPTIIELFSLEDYTLSSDVGDFLIQSVPNMISPARVYYSYGDLVSSAIRRFKSKGRIRDAHAAFLLMEQGTRFIKYRQLSVVAENPDFYLTLHDRSTDDILQDLLNKLNTFCNLTPKGTAKSSDYADLARSVLYTIRKDHIFA